MKSEREKFNFQCLLLIFTQINHRTNILLNSSGLSNSMNIIIIQSNASYSKRTDRKSIFQMYKRECEQQTMSCTLIRCKCFIHNPHIKCQRGKYEIGFCVQYSINKFSRMNYGSTAAFGRIPIRFRSGASYHLKHQSHETIYSEKDTKREIGNTKRRTECVPEFYQTLWNHVHSGWYSSKFRVDIQSSWSMNNN